MVSPGKTALLLAAVLVCAPSASADPIVSGYGGPGSGDQNLLGSTLLPAPASGSRGGGGDSDSPRSVRAAPTRVAAPALSATPRSAISESAAGAPAAGATAAAPAAARATRSAATSRNATARRGAERGTTAGTAPVGEGHSRTRTVDLEVARAPVVSPGATTSAGALPISGTDLGIALLVLMGLGAVAVAGARAGRLGPTPA